MKACLIGWAGAGAVALAIALGAISEYHVDILSRIMIFAILAISMELTLGTTGLVSFGQAAFFGVGAYSVVLMQKYFGITHTVVALGAAITASALAGALVGVLCLRTKSIYFIMSTLAFAQMFFHFAHDTPLLGGSDGIYLAKPLQWGPSGQEFLLSDARLIAIVALLLLVSSFGAASVVLRSRFGRALRGIGSNEQRMRAMGFSTYGYKLAIFIGGAGLAGVAGFLYCAKNGAVTPETMAWQQSGVVLLMVIIGGVGRLWGAVAGAAIYVCLQEILSSSALIGPLADHWLLLFGIAVIAIVAAWPTGFAGSAERLLHRLREGEGRFHA